MNNDSNNKVEVEGSTVEEAIQKGLKELNVTRDKVTVKIVCEEKRGLFGMGGEKPAKVIISLK